MSIYWIFIPNCQESFRVTLEYAFKLKGGSVMPSHSNAQVHEMRSQKQRVSEGGGIYIAVAQLSSAVKAEIKKL